MKQILTILIIGCMSWLSTPVWAQNNVRYQSTANGLSIVVPDDTELTDDTDENLVLEGEDFTLIFRYLDTEGKPANRFDSGLQEIATAAETDLSNMKQREFSNSTFQGIIFDGSTPEGDNVMMGGLDVINADNISFLFSLSYPADKQAWAEKLIHQLQFHPEAIE